jgi:hypothetical protein
MSTLRLMRVVVKVSVAKKALYVATAAAISAAMLAHATSYANAPVDLNAFKAQCATLTAWQAQARERIPGAAAQRDAALAVVAASVELLRAFVEQLCNGSPEQAATLAQGAGMFISSRAPRAKVPLRAKQGGQPGTVILYASVALLVTGKGGRYFSWQSSIDGGKTWVSAPSTPNSSTTLTGLPVLTECLFRACVTLNKTGQGPWTAPVPFLVH